MIYHMSLPDGIYEYVSPASVTITGYTPHEFYDNPLLIRKFIEGIVTDIISLSINDVCGSHTFFFRLSVFLVMSCDPMTFHQ
jgi:hypothetical protein